MKTIVYNPVQNNVGIRFIELRDTASKSKKNTIFKVSSFVLQNKYHT